MKSDPGSQPLERRRDERDPLAVSFVLEPGRAAATLGVELGTFAGALAVGLASSAYAWWCHRPAAVVSVPGIPLLVPGSVGFRGLTSLILTAMALVAGLLIAAVIAPERGMPPAARRS